MRKPRFIIGIIISSIALAWLGAGPWGALNAQPLPDELFKGSDRPRHRLVATLVCQEPTETFLDVMSMRRTKPNPVAITVTEALVTDALNMNMETWIAVVQPDQPFRISCADVPENFSKEAPVVVHLDSRYPTHAFVMHLIRGSPIAGVASEFVISGKLQ